MPLTERHKHGKHWGRLLGYWLLLLVILLQAARPIGEAAVDELEPPALTAEGAILIDADTGQVLYEKRAREPFYPASITKILTAIVAIENGRLDDVVTVSEEAIRADGTRVYLVAGEQKTLRELLYAMMVNSGNDAAIAIAEHIAGSVEAFADMMNEKAAVLGATDSHFVNPSGLHDDNHYTTAHDMAIIAQYAMRNPIFREIVGTKTMPWNGDEWQSQLVNHNKLLWRYEGATGVKNGYTSKAKQTFVATAKKGDTELLAVCLQAPSQAAMYHDLQTLLDYGFNAFEAIPAVSASDQFYSPDGSLEVPLWTSRDIHILRPKSAVDGEIPAVTTKVVMDAAQTEYPIYKGEQLGKLYIGFGDQSIIQAPLYAKEAIIPVETADNGTSPSSRPLSPWVYFFIIILAGLSIAYYRKTKSPRKLHLPMPIDRRNTIQ